MLQSCCSLYTILITHLIGPARSAEEVIYVARDFLPMFVSQGQVMPCSFDGNQLPSLDVLINLDGLLEVHNRILSALDDEGLSGFAGRDADGV